MSDAYTPFRLFVVAVLVIGLLTTWFWISRTPGESIEFGGRTYSKRGFTRFVIAWNVVGIPILLFFLFVMLRP